MTLFDLLCQLRERLIQNDNAEEAEDLFITLATLRDLSYSSQDEALVSIIVDLTDTARDKAMGVAGKSQIPSVEAIREIFSPSTRASNL